MTDDRLEKVRKEVERRINELQPCNTSDNLRAHGAIAGYYQILSFINSMQEEPRFKVGQTITDPEDSTFTFHINKIEDGKYIESDDAWVLIKDADEEYELVEEPVSNVWHDMIEEAENGRNIIIIDPKDFYGAVLRKGGAQLKNHNKERYVKWAYIDDIINITNKEETVSKDRFAFKAIPRLLEMLEPNDRAKAYTNRLADALEKEGYNTDAKIVREKIRVMNGETVAMATMDEEPVSEELEEAAWLYYDKNRLPIPPECDLHKEFIDFFKAGAKWKEEQFEKNRLKHCNSITNEQAELEQGFIDQHLDKHQRMPTFLDAIEYGMKLMKEQMMKDAVECYIGANKEMTHKLLCFSPRGQKIALDDALSEIRIGDKVRVKIIKED